MFFFFSVVFFSLAISLLSRIGYGFLHDVSLAVLLLLHPLPVVLTAYFLRILPDRS